MVYSRISLLHTVLLYIINNTYFVYRYVIYRKVNILQINFYIFISIDLLHLIQYYSGCRVREAPERAVPSLKYCTLPFDRELGHGWDTEYVEKYPIGQTKVRHFRRTPTNDLFIYYLCVFEYNF